MKSVLGNNSCPACNADACSEALEIETFPYGDKGVEISAEVPVIQCTQCDFVFTDQRAEKIRHQAVCDFLGLLSPEQILHIRKSVLGMSRETFHAAFGLSSASVERWENGKLFQGEAADTLIRAIEDPATASRLDRRGGLQVRSAESTIDNVVWGRFRSLDKHRRRAQDALARSKNFNLRMSVG